MMITKYKCDVDGNGHHLIVSHDEINDFWFLPRAYMLKRPEVPNHFSDLQEIERTFDITLDIVEAL